MPLARPRWRALRGPSGDLFAGASIPNELASAILEAYASLPGANPPVAVRSSATAEDLPEASFAGQQETYLNIRGADGVLAAVKDCWASLWTARAIGYRLRQSIPPESVALAVVVQLLVDAEAAGILFTANPLNGQPRRDRDQRCLGAGRGGGRRGGHPRHDHGPQGRRQDHRAARRPKNRS